MSRVLLFAVLLPLFLLWAGCVPPHGFGHHPLPGGRNSFAVRGAFDYGVAKDRHVFQVDLGGSGQLTKHFSMEAGVLYTALRAPSLYTGQQDDASQFEHSALPYVSPVIHAGPVTVALSLSALPLVGPEAGILMGYGTLVVRYDREHWGAYAGLGGHAVDRLSQDGELISTYWESGGGAQYEFVFDGFLLGLSADVFYGEHDYEYHGPQRSQRFVMGMLGVQLGYKGE